MSSVNIGGNANREDSEQLTILVVQPDARCDMARIEQWLAEEHVNIELVRPFLGEQVPTTTSADGVMVLGGSMNVGEDDRHPWLGDAGELFRSVVADDTPALGVCLGAQIAADALGGSVAKGADGLESGVVEMIRTEAGKGDPLFGALDDSFMSGEFHYEAITALPDRAVRLARGDRYENQAFRIGSTWAVQFHPEIGPERFDEWATHDRAVNPELGETFDAQLEQFQALDAQVAESNRRLVKRFVELVRESRVENDVAGVTRANASSR